MGRTACCKHVLFSYYAMSDILVIMFLASGSTVSDGTVEKKIISRPVGYFHVRTLNIHIGTDNLLLIKHGQLTFISLFTKLQLQAVNPSMRNTHTRTRTHPLK